MWEGCLREVLYENFNVVIVHKVTPYVISRVITNLVFVSSRSNL